VIYAFQNHVSSTQWKKLELAIPTVPNLPKSPWYKTWNLESIQTIIFEPCKTLKTLSWSICYTLA